MHELAATGIGLYYQLKENDMNATIYIQAFYFALPSVLQAEASALLLAAFYASQFGIHKMTFLTDNLTLAKAAAAKHASDPQVAWEIRSYIADFHNYTRSLDATVYHINRNLNGIAHRCAHKALRQSMSQPICL